MSQNFDFFCCGFLLKELSDKYGFCACGWRALRIVSFARKAFMENKVKLRGNSGDSANSSTRLFLSSFQYLLLEILLEQEPRS